MSFLAAARSVSVRFLRRALHDLVAVGWYLTSWLLPVARVATGWLLPRRKRPPAAIPSLVKVCDSVSTGRGRLRAWRMLGWQPVTYWLVALLGVVATRWVIAGADGAFWPSPSNSATWLGDRYAILLDAGIFPILAVCWIRLPSWGQQPSKNCNTWALSTVRPTRPASMTPHIGSPIFGSEEPWLSSPRLPVSPATSSNTGFPRAAQRVHVWITLSGRSAALGWLTIVPVAIWIINLLSDHIIIVSTFIAVVRAGGVHPKPFDLDGSSGFGAWNRYVMMTAIPIALLGVALGAAAFLGPLPRDPATIGSMWLYASLYGFLAVTAFVLSFLPAHVALAEAREDALAPIDARLGRLRESRGTELTIAALERDRALVALMPRWPFRLRVPLEYFATVVAPILGLVAVLVQSLVASRP